MNIAEATGAESRDTEDAAATGAADEVEEMLVPETLESAPDAELETQPARMTPEWQPDDDDFEPEGVADISEMAPRPRKVAKTARNAQRPNASGPSSATVAAACLDHIKAVGTERRQNEDTRDTPYHFCMAAAGFLRSMPADDQFDTMCAIQAVIQQKMLEVRARRTEQ
ncbi:uncharacterized protein LOC119454548 [Dermacentor silvarum]|uniref:uncharacterized protein LOC119454548 n=1 Tax=Dermacentor silvarum TaxID=543639 RepID=UPI00210169E0|nr:uncharacterized protein LOC119454548 [Dermacentor silvarum]XP_049522999.1 uncharacterized protein LOC119454548 [Dermacentor silvarum]